MELTAVHQALLGLLKEIDEICVHYQINYSLFGGTIIGAVRHQGFIPWDDDADVVFERKEFEKFIKVLPKEFELIRDPWVYRLIKKSGHISIDIFVFDVISSNSFVQKTHILKAKFLQGTLKSSLQLSKGGLIGKILAVATYLIGLPFTRRFKLMLYDKIATKYNYLLNYQFLYSSLDQYKYIGHVLPKRIVETYSRVKFEDVHLMIMTNYHEYLSKFYGDYMSMPPKENRIPAHGRVKE